MCLNFHSFRTQNRTKTDSFAWRCHTIDCLKLFTGFLWNSRVSYPLHKIQSNRTQLQLNQSTNQSCTFHQASQGFQHPCLLSCSDSRHRIAIAMVSLSCTHKLLGQPLHVIVDTHSPRLVRLSKGPCAKGWQTPDQRQYTCCHSQGNRVNEQSTTVVDTSIFCWLKCAWRCSFTTHHWCAGLCSRPKRGGVKTIGRKGL